MPLLDSELTVDLTYHPDLGETTKVLDDYSTYQQHEHVADALPDDIATARVVSQLQRDLVIALVRYENEIVPIRLDPSSGKVEEIADDLVLENLRCDQSAPIAFVDPAVVEKLRHRAVSTWLSKRRLPTNAKVLYVCSCRLVGRESPPQRLVASARG